MRSPFIAVCLLSLQASVGQQHDPRLVAAIEKVESRGNPAAVGDGGSAIGILQIRPIMVREVNRILGSQKYTLADRSDPAKSREMFWVFADHHGGTAEQIARRWNGGGRGDKKPATAGYWKRVKAEMK